MHGGCLRNARNAQRSQQKCLFCGMPMKNFFPLRAAKIPSLGKNMPLSAPKKRCLKPQKRCLKCGKNAPKNCKKPPTPPILSKCNEKGNTLRESAASFFI